MCGGGGGGSRKKSYFTPSPAHPTTDDPQPFEDRLAVYTLDRREEPTRSRKTGL